MKKYFCLSLALLKVNVVVVQLGTVSGSVILMVRSHTNPADLLMTGRDTAGIQRIPLATEEYTKKSCIYLHDAIDRINNCMEQLRMSSARYSIPSAGSSPVLFGVADFQSRVECH